MTFRAPQAPTWPGCPPATGQATATGPCWTTSCPPRTASASRRAAARTPPASTRRTRDNIRKLPRPTPSPPRSTSWKTDLHPAHTAKRNGVVHGVRVEGGALGRWRGGGHPVQEPYRSELAPVGAGGGHGRADVVDARIPHVAALTAEVGAVGTP